MRTQLQMITASILVCTPLMASPPDPPRETRTRVVLNDPSGLRVLEGAEGAAFFMSGRRTFLGVQLMALTPELRAHYGAPTTAGMLVAAVSDDSPARRAGIHVGDVLTQIGSQRIENLGSVVEAMRQIKDGERTSISVVRNGAPLQLSAEVEERDRKALALNRLPEGIRVYSSNASSAPELRQFLAGPEWQERLMKLEDCRDSQQKLRELETRLKELEKRLR